LEARTRFLCEITSIESIACVQAFRHLSEVQFFSTLESSLFLYIRIVILNYGIFKVSLYQILETGDKVSNTSKIVLRYRLMIIWVKHRNKHIFNTALDGSFLISLYRHLDLYDEGQLLCPSVVILIIKYLEPDSGIFI
jgi:hypothetical protein